MSGLERMIEEIMQEAAESARLATEETVRRATAYRQTKESETAKQCALLQEQHNQALAQLQERTASSIDLQRRTALLTAKQQLINETLELAVQSLSSLDQAAYEKVLLQLVDRFAHAEEGEVLLNAQDRAKISVGFVGQLAQIAKKKGGKLTLSDDTRPIDKGLVLVYGGIEENCSFRGLLNAQKDRLQDLVQQVLFSEQN